MSTRVIVGCGYLGSRVAELWRQAGDSVFTVTRSPERAVELANRGFQPVVADVLVPDSLPKLPPCQTLLYAVGPRGQSTVSRFALYRDGLATVLERWGDQCDQVILISSTGVYGDGARGLVDETHPRNPDREATLALVAAEDLLLSESWARKAIILRLGGIYGPGRLPLLKLLKTRQPLPSDPSGWLNLIYVDDAARATVLVARNARSPEVLNVVDGHPVPRREFYEEVARLFGLSSPVFERGDADTSTAGFLHPRRGGTGQRWISNRRLVEGYGMTFECPDYRTGLRRVLELEQAKGQRDG